MIFIGVFKYFKGEEGGGYGGNEIESLTNEYRSQLGIWLYNWISIRWTVGE